VPFDYLQLDPTERAFLRTLIGQGRYRDAKLLLGTIPASYQHRKQAEDDHFQALIFAVGRCKDTLTVHPLGPHGLNKRGRPRNVSPYRPLDQLWEVVLRWELPWLFRNELEALPLPTTDLPLGHLEELAREAEWGESDLAADYLPAHRRQHSWATEKYALRTGTAEGVSPAMRAALRLKWEGQPVNKTPTGREVEEIRRQLGDGVARRSYIEYCTVGRGRRPMMEVTSPALVERVSRLEVELARQQAFNAEVARQVGIALDDEAVSEAVESFLVSLEESEAA